MRRCGGGRRAVWQTRQSADLQNRGLGVGASQRRRGRAQSGDTAQAMARSCRHAVCRRRKSNDGVHELPRPIRRQLLRRRVHALQHLVPRGKQEQPEGGARLVPERAAGTEEGAHALIHAIDQLEDLVHEERACDTGTYYNGACVDSVMDEFDTTNNCSGSIPIDVISS